MRTKLTEKVIPGLKTSDSKGVVVFDCDPAAPRGFGIRITAKGRKSFVLKYGPEGRRRVYTLGDHPGLSLKDAREEAEKLRGRVLSGVDPAREKADGRQALTFGLWSKQYLEQIVARKKRPQEDRRYLAAAAKVWGNRLLAEIRPEDVATFRERFAADGHTTQGNRALASVRACLEEALRRSLLDDNPASRLRPYRENAPRQRVLTDPEMKMLLRSLDTLEDPLLANAFLLLVETGARTSEVLRAKWENIDLEAGVWSIPSPKADIPQSIPLTPTSKKRLSKLPKVGPWLCPGLTPFRHRTSLLPAWRALKTKAGLSGVNLHDLRRTTGLSVYRSHGLHVASKLLRHSDVRVTARVYAPLAPSELAAAAKARVRALPKRR